MAKVFIEETTLSAIGDAIRDKEGTSDLIPVTEMSSRISAISSGGEDNVPAEIVLTKNQAQRFSEGCFDWIIENFGSRIRTENLLAADNMFTRSNIARLPFELNFADDWQTSLGYLFLGCSKLVSIPDITFPANTKNSFGMRSLFQSCSSLETLPYIYNAYPENVSGLFQGCYRLRSIPDDYFDTWNFNEIYTYQYADSSKFFSDCYSLRALPMKLLEQLSKASATSASYIFYASLVSNCYVLDEIVNLPVYNPAKAITSNMFISTFFSPYRLKNLTFALNPETGTPYVVQWKSQTIDLSSNVGYVATPSYVNNVVGYNSGITEDKLVTDAASYEALKNDPDWFTYNYFWCRYNHDSAVATINSLPDTSAYLASAGGTNTIKFKGLNGQNTDGGAINTLTEEEIAVAAAKGWTVTFS